MNRFNSDIYVEYMVKKKVSNKDIAITIGAIALGILLIMLSFIFLVQILGSLAGQFIMFIAIGVIAGIYFLVTSRNLEFEYSVTNGDITIDKIMSRKSRKRLTSFDAKNIEEMGQYAGNEATLKAKTFDKTIFAGVYDDGRESIYIIAKSNKTGRTLLVFDPSEKVLDAMKFSVPREIRTQFYGR